MSILRYEAIDNIIKKTIPNGFSYTLRQSETSESLYATFQYNEITTALRFSNHMTTRSSIKTILIRESTKPSLVISTINKSCNNLKKLYLSSLLGMCEIKEREPRSNE